MNDLVMTQDIFNSDYLAPLGDRFSSLAERTEATDAVFTDVEEALEQAAKQGLSVDNDAYPMGDLVEKLRAKFDWSWEIIDVLSDEQLHVLAFSVEEECTQE